jgi:hypothetical protein
MENLNEQIIIRQQIALNNKMLETQKISKQMHAAAHQTLIYRLSKFAEGDMISGVSA